MRFRVPRLSGRTELLLPLTKSSFVSRFSRFEFSRRENPRKNPGSSLATGAATRSNGPVDRRLGARPLRFQVPRAQLAGLVNASFE